MIGFLFWIIPIIIFCIEIDRVIKAIEKNTAKITEMKELLDQGKENN